MPPWQYHTIVTQPVLILQTDSGVHADPLVLRISDAENGLRPLVEGDCAAREPILPGELVDKRGLRQQLCARWAIGESNGKHSWVVIRSAANKLSCVFALLCAVHRAGLVHAMWHAPLHCVRAPGAAAAPQAARWPRPLGPAHFCLPPGALSHHLDYEHGRHAALLFRVSAALM